MIQGIDIQYLNGIDTMTAVRYMAGEQAQRLTSGFGTVGALESLHSQQRNIDAVTTGEDLTDYTGTNNTDDCEALRNYLCRTKAVVDGSPALLQSYRNPEQFSDMLDYVLRYWDTADRENAVRLMAKQEAKLIKQGKIVLTEDGKDGDHYNGFFMAVAAAVLPQTEMAEAASDTVLRKFKNRARAAAKKARTVTTDAKTGLRKTAIDKQTLHGLSGHELGELVVSSVLYGFDYYDGLSGEEFEDCDRRYLRHLCGVVQAAPSEFFYSHDEGRRFVSSLNGVIDNWDDDNARADALARACIACPESHLNGFFKKIGKGLKKAAKAVGKGVKAVAKTTTKVAKAVTVAPVKAVAKTTAKVVKTVVKNPATLINPVAATKLAVKTTASLVKDTVIKPTVAVVKHTIVEPTKVIVKVTKKIVKFIIRFNPITLVVRAILLLAARNNWFHLADRCYPGSLTEAEAKAKCGITDKATYDKHVKCYKKFWSVFDKIGGIQSKLKTALSKGYGKAYSGPEKPTKEFVQAGYKGAQKEVDSEIAADEKELKDKGAQEVTNKGDDYYEQTQTTVEQVTNMVTTIQATSVFSDPNKADAAAAFSIPKGKQVLFDTTYTDGQFLRVEYEGKRGYARKKCFAGQTETPVYGLTATAATSVYATVADATAKKNAKQAIAKGDTVLMDNSKTSGNYYYVTVTKKSGTTQTTVSGYAPKSAFAAPKALNGVPVRSRGTIDPEAARGLGAIDVIIGIVSAVSALVGIVATVAGYFKQAKAEKEQQKQQKQAQEAQAQAEAEAAAQAEAEAEAQAAAQVQAQQVQAAQAAAQAQQLTLDTNALQTTGKTTEAGMNKYVMIGAAAVGVLLLLGMAKKDKSAE